MEVTQLASAIKQKRQELGLTQEQVAMVSGSGVRFIVDLEKGKPTCQIGLTLKVLQVLGLRIEFK
jgi:y4mF family transcriptional regulator